ncbi:protein of unknown function [Burkholderia multivorans]
MASKSAAWGWLRAKIQVHHGLEGGAGSIVGVRPILLKNSFSHAAGPAREKSTSQIALQAAREHRLGVRGPSKTSP